MPKMAEGLHEDAHDTSRAAPPSPAPRVGGVRFVEAGARAGACAELESRGMILARVDAIAVTSRGRLADLVNLALARALSAREPRGVVSPTSEIELALVSAAAATRGVVLALGSLRALVDHDGALDPYDSRTVRALARMAQAAPFVLMLDAADTSFGAYADPTPLVTLREPCEPAPAPAPTVTPTATPTPPPPPAAPVRALPPPEVWRPWVIALTAARGPQPLAAFEKIFATAYMPLTRAIEVGLEDSRALAAHDEFRRAFARTYGEACPTFAVTGKRPRMVFDAPDVAARTARLHGARQTQLLLVDAMRFDLGLRVRDALGREIGDRASLAEEMLLWSALPTSTSRQLELLARGLDGLRAPPESEREGEPMRGRTAETIRRVKVGHRDLYKLDVIQARIAEPLDAGSHVALANDVAGAIARHAETLSSRTLLFVFGDHGFVTDRAGATSTGGASPEEVLVPAFAYLVGAVH
jgi:hypothetical protein